MTDDVDVPEALVPDERQQLGLGCVMCGGLDPHVKETGWMCAGCAETF